eukprot:TRINITY_DN374_c0_g1_i11.p1 TRINITY_DN374_c0_g1~~TRINITY_DN374_c0_g1_i11.p1  ORF type:complete len:123 (+),score=27.52 TRINITY_DN374_c0_g1_i11:135-503(+)
MAASLTIPTRLAAIFPHLDLRHHSPMTGNGSIPVPSNMTGNGSIPVPSNTTGSDSLPTSRFATSLEATQKDTTVESENTHSTWLVALVGSFSGLAVVVAVVTYKQKRVSGPQETALVESCDV